MIKRSKLRLVTGKKPKDTYEVATVHMCDDTVHMFRMDEWDAYKTMDWIDFVKKDDTIMESFFCSNIMRIVFERKKEVSLTPVA